MSGAGRSRSGGAVPPPVTNSSEDLERRDNAAIAHAASLLPGNTDKANRAALIRAEDGLPAWCDFGPPWPAARFSPNASPAQRQRSETSARRRGHSLARLNPDA
jgi:hypothetical protein